MDHEKFQQRLNAVLDKREQPQQDAQLRQMADVDGDCAETLEATQLLLESVELLKHPTVRPDMADRVLASLTVERSPAHRLRIWMPLCVAAALLLAAIPLYRFWNSPDDEQNPTVATPNHTETPPSVVEATDEVGYLVQTHRAGEALGEVIWANSFDQLTPTQKVWVERATAEISPVADPMTNTVAITVDAVIRTIEPNIPKL
jgi:hypothetical protein